MNTNLTELVSRGRASYAIPHYAELARIAAVKKLSYNPTMDYCTEAVRGLVKELKTKKEKATLKQYAKYLQKVANMVKLLQGMRRSARAIGIPETLEERVVEKFYAPFKNDIHDCSLPTNSNAKIIIKRGVPKVTYTSKNHGYGYGAWEEFFLNITFPKGWTKLAKAGKHMIPTLDGQKQNLIVEWEPIVQMQQPLDFGQRNGLDECPDARLANVRVVKRGSGTKSLSARHIVAEYAGVYAAGETAELALLSLPRKVTKAVLAKFN